MVTWLNICPHKISANADDSPAYEATADMRFVDLLRREERECAYPGQSIAFLTDKNFFEFLVSGGDKFDLFNIYKVASTTAELSGSLAITVCINALALLPVWVAGDEDQIAKVDKAVKEGAKFALGLTEWELGSDLSGTKTTGHLVGEHYILNGSKSMINQASFAEQFVVLVRTSDADPEKMLGKSQGLSVFQIERGPGVKSTERLKTLPMASADISGFELKEYKAPQESLLGKEGEGFKIIQNTLNISRGGVSALSSGASTKARRLVQEYIFKREIYGNKLIKVDAVFQNFRKMCALEMGINAMSIKSYTMSNLYGQRASYYTTTAKFICCDLAEESVNWGRRILSARALLVGDYETLIRDVLLYGTFDGTRQVMLEWLKSKLKLRFRKKSSAKNPCAFNLVRESYTCIKKELTESVRTVGRAILPHPAVYSSDLVNFLGGSAPIHFQDIGKSMEAISNAISSCQFSFKEEMARCLAHSLAMFEVVCALYELSFNSKRDKLGIAALKEEVSYVESASKICIHILSSRIANESARLAERLRLSSIARDMTIISGIQSNLAAETELIGLE